MAIFGSFWDDFKHSIRTGNMVTRLITINFAVFIIANVAYLLTWVILGTDHNVMSGAYYKGLNWFCMPGDWHILIRQPWSILTSIFLHEEIRHFLFNIMGLYLFGNIVADLIGDRKILPIYLLGGLAGNLIYLISAHFFPYIGGYALGASGAIMALGGAALIIAPEYRVVLLLLGEVKLKYIVFVMLLLDMVGIADQVNTGGHAAHLGGFIMGCFIIYQLHDGKDWSIPINNAFDTITRWFSRDKRRPVVPKKRKQPAFKTTVGGGGAQGHSASDVSDLSFQERLDAILDKIKQNGYENLTQDEKDFLYDASKK
jgi:membrane associated rhomboid family serine protease